MNRKGKIMHIFLWGIAAVLAVYSLYLATHSNFNFGLLLVYGLTALALASAVFYEPLGRFCRTLPGRLLLAFLGLSAALGLGVLAFILASAHSAPPTGNEKAMVVLGAGLRGDRPSRMLRCRLDAAYEYYRSHPELIIVTTGGQGRDEWVPEGRAMKDYLVAKGVPEEKILSEEASTSTEENFLFSLPLLEERGITAQDEILLVTNGFHCCRALRYAAMAGFGKTAALPAPTPASAVLPSYMREVAAICYYWAFRSSRSGFMQPMVGILSLNKKIFYK